MGKGFTVEDVARVMELLGCELDDSYDSPLCIEHRDDRWTAEGCGFAATVTWAARSRPQSTDQESKRVSR